MTSATQADALRHLLESSLDALVLTTGAGQILFWNWGAEQLFAIPSKDAVGKGLGDLLLDERGREDLGRSYKEAASTGSAVMETAARIAGRAEFNLLILLRPVPEADGAPVAFMAATIRDVSEQRRLEAQLFEQIWSLTDVRGMLTSVLDGSSDFAIIGTDPEGRIQVWNEGARHHFGHHLSQTAGKIAATFLFTGPEIESEHVSHALAAALGSGRFEDEFDCVAADGHSFPARIVVSPRKAPDGNHAGYVLIAVDITEERRAAEALRRKSAFVALLQNVAVAANEAKSVEAAMQRALDEVCAATGWPVGHVYVRAGEWHTGLDPTKIWHLDDPERFDTFRRITEASRFPPGVGLPGRVLASGKPAWIVDVTKDDNFPRARLAQDVGVRAGFGFPVVVGSEIVAVLEFFSARTMAPDEQVLDVMGHIGTILGRVVERARAEAEREEAVQHLIEIERLKEVQRFKEQFIRNVSHELKTPITPIKLQLQVLRAPELGALTATQERSLAVVERNVERLHLLVQDMLDVAQLQSGTLRIVKEATSLEEVLREATDLFTESARQAQVRLTLLAAEHGDLLADRRRLIQVLVNFVSNALKFTPAAGQITVGTRRLNSEVMVRVTDSGQGLSKEQIARLFQPFSQVHDPTKVRGGTGLGLYICKSIIEGHGGRIGCESEGPGRGSTFWFTVPLRETIPLKEATGKEPGAEPPLARDAPLASQA